MTGGMVWKQGGVSVTREIWDSTRSPRATANCFHQLTLTTSLTARDAVLEKFVSKIPVNTLICKQPIIGEEFLKNDMQEVEGYWGQGSTHPGISGTQKVPAGSCIDSRIVTMQQAVNLAKEDPESPVRVVCDDNDVSA